MDNWTVETFEAWLLNLINMLNQPLFSRGHATLHLAVSVGRSVGRSVTFLNSEPFLRYCSCPTVRDWIAVYPALLSSIDNDYVSMTHGWLQFMNYYH